ncbi:response regulator transcription factor [Catelliglobosispora koreensis]|uniref:response regulator transcription factor n=1 Tax=Catelliglobosispora koreensis TaxID=129052 RepID=UPI00036B5B7E|nr:response regulator transcription factor [Catelliglobosispora koreensis]
MAQLLLVEDDGEIRRALIKALTGYGHVVLSAGAGLPAIEAVLGDRPDLVILDLGLPDIDGREVLRMIRAVSAVPVIVATARDGEPAMVEILNLGADDYVHKPFGAAQLDARIRAVLRRGGNAASQPEPVVVGGLKLDSVSRMVTLDDQPIELTPREFDLLFYLASRPGAVVTKREIVAEVWRQPFSSTDKTLDVHLSWLRRKLGEDARNARYLHTVRGVGVRLTAPDRQASS